MLWERKQFLLGFTGFLFGFHSITGFYWVSIWISFDYWVLLGFHLGFVADYRVLLGFHLDFIRLPGFTGFLIYVMGGKKQFLLGFTGFLFGFHSITGFYWVFIWISFDYWVLLGFHLGFVADYRVLLGFYLDFIRLPSFTGFPFGFHSITGFYWVSV